MSVKVEIGFTADGQGGPFFTLDDPVLGVLDDPSVFLGGGEVFVNVTEYFQSYSLVRGKSRELDRYQAGQAGINFENNQRVFDPNFEDSPYFGQIVPKRNVRITNGTALQFFGVIEDWNISYNPGGQSVATCQAFDDFGYLSGLEFAGTTFPAAETSARIDAILDSIDWPATRRDLAFTGADLSETTYAAGDDVIAGLQITSRSEPGDLFMSRGGDVKLVGRNAAFTSDGLTFSDAGTAIPYKTISAVYGSELLYNRVTVTSQVGTATAENLTSISIYGGRDLTEATYLDSDLQLQELADYLVTRYADPEFRFEEITVDLKDVPADQKQDVVNLELGDVVKVEFTPSKVPPQVVQYGKVIGISQNITPSVEEVTIKLQSTEGSLFVLGDAVFGKLDSGNLLGW